MPLYVWPALGVSLAVALGSALFAAARGLSAWRTFRRFRRRVSDNLAEALQRVAGIETRMGAVNSSVTRLQQAQAELAASVGTARVLSGAFGELRATVGRITGLVPGK